MNFKKNLSPFQALIASVMILGMTKLATSDTVTISLFSANSQNTWLAESAPTTNMGTQSTFYTYEDSGTPAVSGRGLISFDLPDLPENAVVTGATLAVQVHTNSAGSMDVGVYQMYTAWDELQATWNVAQTGQAWATAGMESGVDMASTPLDVQTAEASGTYVTWDITTAVQNWYNGAWTNYGVALIDQTTGPGVRWYSNENTQSKFAPKIEVIYEIVPEPATLGMLILVAFSSFAVRKRL